MTEDCHYDAAYSIFENTFFARKGTVGKNEYYVSSVCSFRDYITTHSQYDGSIYIKTAEGKYYNIDYVIERPIDVILGAV